MTKPTKRTIRKPAVCLSINRPGAMTKQKRREIAAWLFKQAVYLVSDGAGYVDKGMFHARYER